MKPKYFSEEYVDIEFVMRIYEREINNRRNWINESVKNLNEALNSRKASILIHYAMTIINHAMVVVRILDLDAISSRNKDKDRSKERARILHERNPDLPNPPRTLRAIRNDYEHFEEKLDEWATDPASKGYVDLNYASDGRSIVSGVQDEDVFRQIEGTKLTFWNKNVDLQEVITWVGDVNTIIMKNNEQVP